MTHFARFIILVEHSNDASWQFACGIGVQGKIIIQNTGI
jgi:hypothetical protein